MKSNKIAILLGFLITIPLSVCAKNKDRIAVYNNYGSDVTVTVTWQSDSMIGKLTATEESVTLHHNESITLVAPHSYDHAASIDAEPVLTNLIMKVVHNNSMSTLNILDATKTLFNAFSADAIAPKNARYFIINHDEVQSKIMINRYEHEDKYKAAIAKIEKNK